MSLILKAAFIAYEKGVQFDKRKNGKYVTEKLDYGEVSTSLDNIASEDNANMVESMKINIYYAKDPFPGLLSVTKYMQKKSWVLNKVTKLEVGMHSKSSQINFNMAGLSRHNNEIAEFSKAVRQLLPNVTNIAIGGVNSNLAARIIFGHLAGYYADQLQELHSQSAIIVSENVVFEKLQRVYIDADNHNGYTLPRINPRTLEKLQVFNGPAAHSWMPFANTSNLSTIVFSSLKEMLIEHKQFNSKNSQPDKIVVHDSNVKLSFPKLKTLRVLGATGKCTLITAATYSSHLKSVEIGAAPAEFEMLSRVKLPMANRIKISVYSGKDSNNQALWHVNQMLSRSVTSKQVRLEVFNYELPVLVSDITCLSLTSLRVHSPAGVDTLIGILDKLPNLNNLAFYELSLDSYKSDLSIPKLDRQQEERMVPFNTKLASITLNYDFEIYKSNAMVAVVTYLLLRLPMVKWFIVPQTPAQPVFDFVEKYVKLYPYLANIALNLLGLYDSSD